MSDVFSEVDEDIRRDQMKALWDRFGGYLIGAAVAVVAATVGNVVWQNWDQNRKVEASEAYRAAAALVAEQAPNAETALRGVIDGSPAGYAALARFDLAALQVAKPDTAGAIATLDAIAADAGVAATLRDLARMKAALIAIDTASADEVEARLAPLTKAGNAYRPLALEAKAMNAMRDGREDDARTLYDELSRDFKAPAGVRFRANAMLDVLGRPQPVVAVDPATDGVAEDEAAQ
ncbi:MAG: tetratricopeptide repeat protein [Alphaproteobacteria bacterium]